MYRKSWLGVYRISRILELDVLDERFERPANFALADYWHGWSERYQASVYRAEAIVRLSPRGVTLLPYLLTAVETRAAQASAGPPDEQGWRAARLPIESIQHAHAAFLQLGAELEVLAPAELRDHVRETAWALAELYSDHEDALNVDI